jgi:hypothetical protein
MDMIYNSPNFCVVEFKGFLEAEPDSVEATPTQEPDPAFMGGYEIVDKFARKEIFIDGALAEHFREQVQQLINNEPTMEEIDDFLSGFSSLMQQPVVLH